jgi:tetratricopeptide (TPR) repeat protein
LRAVIASALVCCALSASVVLASSRQRPRNDYAVSAFKAALDEGLRHFYARDFKTAQSDFARSLAIIDDNTLAISFFDAAAAQRPDELSAVLDAEEEAVAAAPGNYARRVRLGFAYLFAAAREPSRVRDARDAFDAAIALAPERPAAHVGLGIMRFGERSVHRAKIELLTAARQDPNDVLAREYLGQLYQSDLRDPQRALSYEIEIPNLVPSYADIFFHLGSLFYDLDKQDAALAYLRRGIALDVGRVGEAGQRGEVLAARALIKAGKREEAKQMLRSAISSDAEALLARKLLRTVESGDDDAAHR